MAFGDIFLAGHTGTKWCCIPRNWYSKDPSTHLPPEYKIEILYSGTLPARIKLRQSSIRALGHLDTRFEHSLITYVNSVDFSGSKLSTDHFRVPPANFLWCFHFTRVNILKATFFLFVFSFLLFLQAKHWYSNADFTLKSVELSL